MEENEYTEFDYILTPMVSNMLKEHHDFTRTKLGTDATEEEKEQSLPSSFYKKLEQLPLLNFYNFIQAKK